MNAEEYQATKEGLLKQHEAKLSKLAKKYAFGNNDVQIGDTVTGHETLVVDRIQYTTGSSCRLPECCYLGRRLTGKNIPYKSGEQSTVYQHALKKHNTPNNGGYKGD